MKYKQAHAIPWDQAFPWRPTAVRTKNHNPVMTPPTLAPHAPHRPLRASLIGHTHSYHRTLASLKMFLVWLAPSSPFQSQLNQIKLRKPPNACYELYLAPLFHSIEQKQIFIRGNLQIHSPPFLDCKLHIRRDCAPFLTTALHPSEWLAHSKAQ